MTEVIAEPVVPAIVPWPESHLYIRTQSQTHTLFPLYVEAHAAVTTVNVSVMTLLPEP